MKLKKLGEFDATPPINTDIVPSEVEGYAYENTENTIQTFFKEKIASYEPVLVTTPYGTLAWQLFGVSYRDNEGNEEWIERVREESTAEVEGNKVTYRQTILGMDDVFIVEEGKVKHNIVVHSLPPYSGSLPGEVFLAFEGRIDFSESLRIYADGEHKTTNFRTTGKIELRDDEEDITVFELPDPVVFEESDERAETKCFYEVIIGDQFISFFVEVPYDWLTDTSRQFPVVVDPTIVFPGPPSLGGRKADNTVILKNKNLVAYSIGDSTPIWGGYQYLYSTYQFDESRKSVVLRGYYSNTRNARRINLRVSAITPDGTIWLNYSQGVNEGSPYGWRYTPRAEYITPDGSGPVSATPRGELEDKRYPLDPANYVIVSSSNGIAIYRGNQRRTDYIPGISYLSMISTKGWFLARRTNSTVVIGRASFESGQEFIEIIDDPIPTMTSFNSNATRWDKTGTVIGVQDRLIKVDYPDYTIIPLPSTFLDFHPTRNIILMDRHMCKYDPDTGQIYSVMYHGQNLPSNPQIASFNYEGDKVISVEGGQFVVYDVVPDGNIAFADDNGSILFDNNYYIGVVAEGDYTTRGARLVNASNYPIGNITISVDNIGMDSVTLSSENDPFVPYRTLTFPGLILEPMEYIEFYIRVWTDPNNPHPIRRVPIRANAEYILSQ